jgi:hypothetical protein
MAEAAEWYSHLHVPEFLPAVTCFATLGEVRSELTVVWFQDEYAPPILESPRRTDAAAVLVEVARLASMDIVPLPGGFFSMMDETSVDLPNDVKAKLLELAKRLPEASRGRFASSVRDRLAAVALEHPRTIVYAIAGFVIGTILDHVLTVHVPLVDVALEMTGGKLAWLFTALGILLGKFEDMEEKRRRTEMADIVARVVGEELRLAFATKGAQ